MEVLSKAHNFINREVKGDNESKKMTILIRKLLLVILAFMLVSTIVCLFWGRHVTLYNLVSLFIVTSMMHVTYSKGRMITVWSFVIGIMVMSWLNLMVYGWYCGAQTFLLMLVMIFYFSSYSSVRKKMLFSAFVFVVYMALYFVFKDKAPMCPLELHQMTLLRFGFMACLIICCSLMAYIFSIDSQSMESKLVEYNKRLEDKANTDPLTGLYNRGKIMEIMEKMSDIDNGENFSVCICDIDFFKKVNDNFGHNVGDEVLKAVSGVFSKFMKGKGYVGRWGGEEFIILFPGLNGDDACSMIYSIQDLIRKTIVVHDGEEIKVTLTYGLTEYDFHAPINQNIKDADDKLYAGKLKGRNILIY